MKNKNIPKKSLRKKLEDMVKTTKDIINPEEQKLKELYNSLEVR